MFGFGSAASEKGKEYKQVKGKDPGRRFGPARWEYKVARLPLDDEKARKELDALGADGWELAGTRGSNQMGVVSERPKK